MNNVYDHVKVRAVVSPEPQTGKTVATIKKAAESVRKGRVVNYTTHGLNDIKKDFVKKAREWEPEIDWINPLDDKSKFKMLNNYIAKHRRLPDEARNRTAFVGLSNHHHYKAMNDILRLCEDVKEGFIDEADTMQPGFGYYFKDGIQKDNWQDAMIESGAYDGGVTLITATKFLLAANNIHYDSVDVIEPYDSNLWKGFENVEWDIVNKRDIEQLYQAEFSNTLHQIIREESRNTMINLSRFTLDHTKIASGLTSLDSELHTVNYHNPDFNADILKEGSNIIVGGAKFSRGISYDRVGTLIFDMESDISNLVQYFGRLFRYAQYDIRAVVTLEVYNLLKAAFAIESLLTKDLLMQPPEERHQFLKHQLDWYEKLKLPKKSNGWTVSAKTDRRTEKPKFKIRYDSELFDDMRNTTSIIVPKEGAAPTGRGTTKWGNRSPERMKNDFIEQHPQGPTLMERNDKGSISRKYIIPPYCYEDDNGNVALEFAEAGDDTHWYIDNSMSIEDRESITTKYVDSVSADKKWRLIWVNLHKSVPDLHSSLDNKDVI